MFKNIAITPESKDRLFVNYTALGCWSGNILHSDSVIAGTTGSLLGKETNIKRCQCITKRLLADFLSCLPCLQALG